MANLSIIQTIAQQKGITMSALAEKSGLTKQALFQLIRNNSTKVSTLETISQVLGVSPSVFFDNENVAEDKSVDLLKVKIKQLELINEALNKQIEALTEANKMLNDTLFH